MTGTEKRRRGAQPGHRNRRYRVTDPPEGVPVRVRVRVLDPDYPLTREFFAPCVFLWNAADRRFEALADLGLGWFQEDELEVLGWAYPLPPRRQGP